MENSSYPPEEFKKLNDFLLSIMESFAHSFYVIDPKDYTIVYGNRAFWEMVGLSPQKVKCYEVTHHSDQPCSDEKDPCPLREVEKLKRPVKMEHIHFAKDNERKHVEVNGFPILDDNGNLKYMIEYAVDITEKKLAENALNQKINELERFNKMVIGRELKMVELKEEINALLIEQGKKPKYKIEKNPY